MPMSGEGPGRESGQMIVADGLVRRYGAVTAVEDVSFEIGRHEVVGLLGHNGAGKTTIMKMIAGYLEPTAGRVLVDGIEVERDRAVAQARLGYLPENCPLYPEMTVLEHLDFRSEEHTSELQSLMRTSYAVFC